MLHKLKSTPPEEIGIAMIAVAELFYGCYRGEKVRREPNVQALRSVLAPFTSLPFGEEDALQFGKLKALLQEKGRPPADLDIAIASQAITRGLTVVTNNLRHFKRVPGLKTENWAS